MQRHRSDGQITTGSATYTSIGKYGQPDVNYASTSSPTGQTRTMDDVITPNFRSSVAKGAIIINPMTSVKTTVTASPKQSECLFSPASNWNTSPGFVGDRLTDALGMYFAGNLSYPVEALPDYSAYDLGLAVTSAWANVATPTALSLVSALEAKQTLEFLRAGALVLAKKADPFQQLKDQARRGKLSLRDFRRKAGDFWLGYRYGAMPLLYDLEGHLKALTFGTGYTSYREHARGYSGDSFSGTKAGPAGSNSLRTYTSQWAWEGQHKYRAGVIYSAGYDVRSNLGLTLADVPQSMWESTRLSFVADWALNVGEYLQAWSGYSKAKVLGSWKTVTTESTAVLTYQETAGKYVGTQKGPLYSSLTQDASGATLTYDIKRVVRSASDIYDGTLGPRLQINTKRIADAFFLLSNALDPRLAARPVKHGVGRTLLRL